MINEIRKLVDTLIKQQTRIFELLDFEERPFKRRPITKNLLEELSEWWSIKGFEIPKSYKDFLMVCDGIDNFSASYSLLGAQDILSNDYSKILDNILKDWIGFDYDTEFPPILIGFDNETTTRVFFHLSHETLRDNEPVVLEGDPGDMSIHDSFYSFLKLHVKSNEITISKILELKSKN